MTLGPAKVGPSRFGAPYVRRMLKQILRRMFSAGTAGATVCKTGQRIIAQPVRFAAPTGRPCDQPPLTNEEMLGRIGF